MVLEIAPKLPRLGGAGSWEIDMVANLIPCVIVNTLKSIDSQVHLREMYQPVLSLEKERNGRDHPCRETISTVGMGPLNLHSYFHAASTVHLTLMSNGHSC